MLNRLTLFALVLLTCLWFALIFDIADIVNHLSNVLLILDSD